MAAIAETDYLPVACEGSAKRMGAPSPLEYLGCQEAIKNVIGGDASRAVNIAGPARDPRCRRPGAVRAESAGSDQPVLQALGRRMPAILHACFT
jgi:hypothetical protein